MTSKLFASTKTYTHEQGLSCCFRQWRAKSHCRFLHGYALQVKLEFRGYERDENGWIVDFGGLKPIKEWLTEMFDHKTLCAEDDPQIEVYRNVLSDIGGIADVKIVKHVGCEAFANMIFDHVANWLQMQGYTKVWLHSVEVREHGGNSAICYDAVSCLTA